jgi:hypothetical protein
MIDDLDQCPHCRHGFEIICVKFGASGTSLVFHCPNCAFVPVEHRKYRREPVIRFQQVVGMIASLNSRFKAVLILALAAILAAAFLRHSIHMYAGISPANIRVGSLLVVSPLAVVLLFLGLRRIR